jgi:hypothetical protein
VASRRLRRSSLAGTLLAASLALAACGISSGSPTILNERAIEHSALVERGQRVNVTCPSGVHQEKGLVFYCTAIFRGGTARFMVTELDGSGNVHYEAR